MDLKKVLHHTLELSSWIALLITSIGLAYFVKDIWNDFAAEKTNDRVFSERQDVYEHPAISICFEPEVNETTLQKYNMITTDLSIDKMINKTLLVPLLTLAEEISFKIGRDFHIEFLYVEALKSTIMTINETGKYDSLQVEELPLFHYGKCTIIYINDEIKTPTQMYNQFNLKFRSSTVENLPLVKIFFTSKNNSYGPVWFQWMEGKQFALAIDPRQEFEYYVNLRLQIQTQLQETSNCSSSITYYTCIARR